MTLTVKVAVETFPAASLAVTVTVVVPTAKVEPEAFEYVIVTGPTRSVAIAAAYDTATPEDECVVTVMFGLTKVKTGGVVSRTVILNVLIVGFPAASFAVIVTVVWPIPKIVPDAFEYVTLTTPTASLISAV